ncbi:MAG: hypothetical protein OEM24_00070 [Paracoccaceae bacterium]|nr:hypothetical protein [Paracoccaceae bacterium]
MRRPKPPLFLERDSYRRRRVADAARVLPVLGALLFLVPLLWAPAETETPDTVPGGLYIFLVWGGLILAAFVLSRRLGPEPPKRNLGESEEGG